MTDFNELLEVIGLMPPTSSSNVIAVSGYGGSGKTTLAAKLAAALEDAAVVAADDFMLRSYKERSSDWRCIDRKRITDQILRPAERGSHLRYQTFVWQTQRLGKEVEKTGKNIILEGIGIIHPDLMQFYDFSIWLDCELEQAAARGMKRDREVLGVDHDNLWRNVWMLNDKDYYEKYRPDTLADCVYKPPERT